MVRQESFGVTKKGEAVSKFVLTNEAGMEVTLISYGAYLTGITVPDRDGKLENVVLSYKTIQEYETNSGYVGACVGRVANRIGEAKFTLNGTEYTLDKNNGANSLHGGFDGWSMRVWDAEVCEVCNSVRFSLTSPHMDQGFPGEMKVSVTYTLTAESALEIQYDAVSDRDTIFNPTNHAYFNLSGKQGAKSIVGEYVKLNASSFTPVLDAASIPTGEIRSVEGTPMDFRAMKTIGRDIAADYDQLTYGGGYDHNWMLDGEGVRYFGTLLDGENGRRMTMYTDMPAVQMYTGNSLDGKGIDLAGNTIAARTGVCFETQLPPDAINKPGFPSPVMKAGEPFTSTTIYAFDTVEARDLISVGEVLIDFLPGDAPGVFLRKPGGAPANCAVSAARMGISTAFCGRVGCDDFGLFLLRTLEENGVKTLCKQGVKEACTTMAFVSLDENGDRSFTFARKPGADMFLKSEDLADEVLAAAKMVHAGSCSLSKGSAAVATRDILRRAHEMGKFVSFDLNYRDVMWDGDDKAAIAAVMEILPYVDVLKVSDSEAEMIGGEAAFAGLMAEKKLTAIVETLGGDGARAFFGTETIQVPVVPANCVDATGAGDAFWGAFLSVLLEEKLTVNADVLRRAMERGAIAGSLCVRRKGAMEALPTAAEVAAFGK